MALRDTNFKSVYRTEDDDILSDFYIPALTESVRYDRAVGFFSAAMLSFAAKGLSAFVGNSGYMRLVFGGELAPDDFAAIQAGYELRSTSLEEISDRFAEDVEKQIDGVSDELFNRRLELLSFLVSNGQLEVKVALRRRGMYHEKFGIFTDKAGERLVFQGSANETAYALLPDFNFESINVFQCWRPELADHFDPYLDGFERLWNNRQKNTLVIDFPTAAKERLIAVNKKARTPISTRMEVELEREDTEVLIAEDDHARSGPIVPAFLGGEGFVLRSHQRSALNAWKAHDYCGVMALATGAGKTITAIYGATKLYEKLKKVFLVIAVPYQSLADQWVDILSRFNVYPVRCYSNSGDWLEQLTKKISLFTCGALNFGCAVVVNRSLQSENFQRLIGQIPETDNLMFIGDECHHHSSENLSKSLPRNARIRLGLSATPENIWNDEANGRLAAYYGPIVAKYSLREALSDGVLTPYKYYPVVVELTDLESEKYEHLSDRIAQTFVMNQEADPEANEPLKLLLIQRSRIIGKAENKVTQLLQLLNGKPVQPLTLFYCGDGSTEDELSGETTRQVDSVSKTLYRLGWRSSHFTARETRAERLQILNNFRTGVIDAMVAIKCLDEGIDVPACRAAYILASSRNPKQFIQRRGRILRRSPGKEFAEIYDFIVAIPPGTLANSEIEKRLILAELERITEFASLSTNAVDTVRTLRPLFTRYGQQHMLVGILSEPLE